MPHLQQCPSTPTEARFHNMSIGRVPGATGIQPSIVDAKGDLIAATAADSVDRLAVGTNNFFLRANSSASTGLEWAGSWTTYTPTITQNAVNVTTSSASARYIRIGNLVVGTGLIVTSGNGTANSRIRISTPLAGNSQNVFIPAGQVILYDASTFNVFPGQLVVEDGSYFALTSTSSVAGNGGQYLGQNAFTVALANSDQIGFEFIYEVA